MPSSSDISMKILSLPGHSQGRKVPLDNCRWDPRGFFCSEFSSKKLPQNWRWEAKRLLEKISCPLLFQGPQQQISIWISAAAQLRMCGVRSQTQRNSRPLSSLQTCQGFTEGRPNWKQVHKCNDVLHPGPWTCSSDALFMVHGMFLNVVLWRSWSSSND